MIWAHRRDSAIATLISPGLSIDGRQKYFRSAVLFLSLFHIHWCTYVSWDVRILSEAGTTYYFMTTHLNLIVHGYFVYLCGPTRIYENGFCSRVHLFTNFSCVCPGVSLAISFQLKDLLFSIRVATVVSPDFSTISSWSSDSLDRSSGPFFVDTACIRYHPKTLSIYLPIVLFLTMISICSLCSKRH